jgi:NitT/TauT family transport system ATP-binding protein
MSLPSPPAITVDNLRFSYDAKVILQDITLKIDEGDFVCLLGQSGCGKSTFLRLIAGLETPDFGEITVKGKPLAGAGLDRGVVFQDYSLFPWLNIGKNLLLALRQKYRRKPSAELREIAEQHLISVGLNPGEIFNMLPKHLSGGMRQRCAISRAFALDPLILLMDEPFGALDAVTRSRLQDLILVLWDRDHRNRKTILFVTHDVDEALLLSTKIFLFGSSPGKIIYEHAFAPGRKPDKEHFFEDKDILRLRNHLITCLNEDVQAKTQAENSTGVQ